MSVLAGVGVAVLGALVAALTLTGLVRRRLAVVTVDGRSMAPTYEPGDRVVVRRCRAASLRTGDIVVVQEFAAGLDWRTVRPLGRSLKHRWLIKRVAAVPGEPVPASTAAACGGAALVPAGAVVLLGDNPDSVDSKQLGFFPAQRVLGRVVRRMGRR